MMLTKCLASLQAMTTPAGCELDIVVVDNNPAPVEQGLVGCYRTNDGRPLIYLHQPRRGIAQARNFILEAAEEDMADWIAMIDDDQIVPPDWLEEMVVSQQSYDADVVQSSVAFDLPTPAPAWGFEKAKTPKWRLGMDRAATGGVLFRSSLIAQYPGLGLRFNESYKLTGGEDRDFFRRAYLRGARIVRTPRAIAVETIPASKVTFDGQVRDAFLKNCVRVRQDGDIYGAPYWILSNSWTATGSLFEGLARLAWAPIASIRSADEGRRQLLFGAKRIAKAFGIYVGFVGFVMPEPYREIHGE
jgi:succinoglycan biosynthesis protein ExoM